MQMVLDFMWPANTHDSKFFKKILINLNSYDFNLAKIIADNCTYDDQKIRSMCKKENFVLLVVTNIRRNKNKKKY